MIYYLLHFIYSSDKNVFDVLNCKEFSDLDTASLQLMEDGNDFDIRRFKEIELVKKQKCSNVYRDRYDKYSVILIRSDYDFTKSNINSQITDYICNKNRERKLKELLDD